MGLLDTLEDTHVAFRTILEQDIDGSEDMYIPHSFTVNLAYMFFQRVDPFNVMIKNYEEKQKEMMETHKWNVARKKWTTCGRS